MQMYTYVYAHLDVHVHVDLTYMEICMCYVRCVLVCTHMYVHVSRYKVQVDAQDPTDSKPLFCNNNNNKNKNNKMCRRLARSHVVIDWFVG